MHPVRKQRLITVLLIVLGSSVVIGLVLFALKENINLFYPPSKIQEAPVGSKIKVGGCVVPGSVKYANEDLRVRFVITDGMASLSVDYTGMLPDLFAEGEAAIADGRLNEEGVLVASQVLAKHDETYTPVEVADALNEQETETRDYAQDVKTCKGLKYDS
jgi:cytochrome c-type biogenesis protein CcmE